MAEDIAYQIAIRERDQAIEVRDELEREAGRLRSALHEHIEWCREQAAEAGHHELKQWSAPRGDHHLACEYAAIAGAYRYAATHAERQLEQASGRDVRCPTCGAPEPQLQRRGLMGVDPRLCPDPFHAAHAEQQLETSGRDDLNPKARGVVPDTASPERDREGSDSDRTDKWGRPLNAPMRNSPYVDPFHTEPERSEDG